MYSVRVRIRAHSIPVSSPDLCLALENGESPTIYGDGEQSRDFTYVANAVEANLLAAQAPAASGKVFNVANGKSISINEVLDVLKRLTGQKRN